MAAPAEVYHDPDAVGVPGEKRSLERRAGIKASATCRNEECGEEGPGGPARLPRGVGRKTRFCQEWEKSCRKLDRAKSKPPIFNLFNWQGNCRGTYGEVDPIPGLDPLV